MKKLSKSEKIKIQKDIDERIKRADHIEEACRHLCMQNNIDPDVFICRQMPAYINFPIPAYFIPDPMYQMKAWWLYREVVEQALNILECMKK